jgi:hypothetical protein
MLLKRPGPQVWGPGLLSPDEWAVFCFGLFDFSAALYHGFRSGDSGFGMFYQELGRADF